MIERLLVKYGKWKGYMLAYKYNFSERGRQQKDYQGHRIMVNMRKKAQVAGKVNIVQQIRVMRQVAEKATVEKCIRKCQKNIESGSNCRMDSESVSNR